MDKVLEITVMFNHIYRGKRVLLTGHTGFKGSWLAMWLQRLGAEVCGIGLLMPEQYSHWQLLQLKMRSEIADIKNLDRILQIFQDFQPDVVFHLAAQPLVRLSYKEPVETFHTNVIGSTNVLEACRKTPSVRAIVAISSDKCYENREWAWGYREDEPLGGYDPYSASKGCAELVISSYRRSFFNNIDYGKKHQTLLASGRAGNVIGGGDWAPDRLVPDIMKAAAANNEVEIHSPKATRPWQHVLEPLSGYLALGQRLLQEEIQFAESWNFGPSDDGIITVKNAATELAKHWDAIRIQLKQPTEILHEANLLRLDCSKARYELCWHGVWTSAETFKYTAQWYKNFYLEQKLNTMADLDAYITTAQEKELPWTQ